MKFNTVRLTNLLGKRKSKVWLGASPLAIALATPPVWAASTFQVEEVVVTATKRAESVQDIPLSVSAFDSQQIALRGLDEVADLAITTPGLVVGESNGTFQVAIRGIGTTITSGIEEPGVAVHIDGVYQTRTRSLDLINADLERIEIVKGPQGTLYGRNATGGAINFITKKPTEEFEGGMSFLAGSDDHLNSTAYVSGALSDVVLVRASALFNEQDGYVDNVTTGQDVGAEKATGGRLSVRLLPTDDLTIDVSAATIDAESHSWFQPLVNTAANPLTTNTDVNVFAANDIFDGEQSQDSASVTAEWALLDNMTFKSISGYSNYEIDLFSDSDGTAVPFISFTNDQDSETYTQEFNLSGSVIDGQVDYVVGGFYLKEDLFSAAILPISGVGTLTFEIDQENVAYAAFADATVHLTEDLRVQAGIRTGRETKKIVHTVAFSACNNFEAEQNWDSTSPKVGFQFDVEDNIMVYAQWQEGFKAGGYEQNSCNEVFEPEEIRAYELGIKSTLVDGRLVFNGALFDYDYTDLQVLKVLPGRNEVENAGGAGIQGAEFQLVGHAADNLMLELAVTWMDAEYEDYFDRNPQTASTSVDVDLSGVELQRAPDITATAAVSYIADLGGAGELTIRGEVYYSDDYTLSSFPDAIPETNQDSYTIENLIISYVPDVSVFGDGELQLNGFVKNISDEEVLLSAFGLELGGFSLVDSLGTYDRGRTWGVETKLSF